jgi:putative endonuclease
VWPFGRAREAESPDGGSARLGGQGEELARTFLRKQGLKILARNYRCPAGEADLIALDLSTRKDTGAETIAFVEVKTRASDRYAPPESAVNADKRRRMKRVAHYYLASRKTAGFAIRFDIVSIVIRPGQEPEVRHIPGAFA